MSSISNNAISSLYSEGISASSSLSTKSGSSSRSSSFIANAYDYSGSVECDTFTVSTSSNYTRIARLQIYNNGNVYIWQNVTIGTDLSVNGALSKGSGSFKIDHPLESKKDTHYLVHSFIEGPQADLIYRGKVKLVNGVASVNIDSVSNMTEGTFEVLCRDVQSFTTNEEGWTSVRSKVIGNILNIEAQDINCTDTISWMVIGERKDPHMLKTGWTDENGKVIVEPLKPTDEESLNIPTVLEQDQIQNIPTTPLTPDPRRSIIKG
jgi:hypothetical protein